MTAAYLCINDFIHIWCIYTKFIPIFFELFFMALLILLYTIWLFMARKLTYKEMEQRIKELEEQSIKHEQAENVLMESESKLKSVLSSMADLVFIFDKDGRYIYYHAHSSGQLYIPPEKFMWKKHSQVMHPDKDRKSVV